jgi:glycosyltransferase involved in cell wall biosynthesis
MLSEVLPYYTSEFEVDLLLLENKINYSIPDDINVICLNKSFSKGGTLSRLVSGFNTIFSLISFLRKKEYSVIVSYLDNYNVLVYIANLFHIKKPLHIVCEQTTDYEFFKNSKMSKWKQNVFKFALKTTYNRVDHIIAVSQNLKKYLVDELSIKQPITVIHNGIDTRKFNLTLPERSSINENFANAKIKLLCIARLDFQKNIMFLLDSFNLVKDELKDANLFILGSGPLKKEVEEKIDLLNLNDRVFLLGFCSNPEEYLKLSDVFLLASRYESFGNVIIEAFACGVPVVTTNYGSVVNEIITSNNLGKIIRQSDAQGFASAIVYVVGNKEKYNKVMLNNYARSKFDVSVKAEEYINTIKITLNNSSPLINKNMPRELA